MANNLQIGRISAKTLDNYLQISRLIGTTSIPQIGRLEIGRLIGRTISAGPAVSVSLSSNYTTVEPGTVVTLTATGGTSWAFSQSAGQAVTFSGSGATRTFVAPALASGSASVVTLDVTASAAGNSDGVASVTITIYPTQVYVLSGDSWDAAIDDNF